MSAQPTTQLDAETPPHHLINGHSQPSFLPENAASETSENWESVNTNISGRLDLLQHTINHLFAQVNQNIAHVNQNIAQVNQNIAQVNQNIATANAKITLNTTQIIQIMQQITQNTSDLTQLKQIVSHIQTNTTLLGEFSGKVLKKTNRLDANTQARVINSHAKLPADRLRPLLNAADTCCEKFPATLAELYDLDGLETGGNANVGRSCLHDYIGVLAS